MARKTDQLEKLIAVYNTADAEMIDTMLRMERIPCVRQKIGAEKYANILMSMNNFGEEIYVEPSMAEEARQVLEKWREQKKQEEETGALEEAEQEKKDNRQSTAARILATVVVVFVICFYFIKMRG